MHSIEIPRQRYLNLIHGYQQGRLDFCTFRSRLPLQWAEERDALWRGVWDRTRAQRCLEQDQLIQGERPRAEPDDPRRFPRMLDRLSTLCIQAHKEEPFRASVQELFAAYRDPNVTVSEAQHIAYPPHIAVFARPLPAGSDHRYPCTVEDIRAQLAQVPEYDLEGLWAIGLAPPVRDNRNAYATYYRWKRPMRKPVILLYSIKGAFDFRLRARSDPGYIKQRYRVERSYGIEIVRVDSRVLCRWSAKDGRRYMVEHVLLHEIGHHVQYQQRWRARLSLWLPSHIKEQFAEDYAIRFHRERRE
jgi:hypothetical protein